MISNITDEAVQKYIKEQAEETRKEEPRGTVLYSGPVKIACYRTSASLVIRTPIGMS